MVLKQEIEFSLAPIGKKYPELDSYLMGNKVRELAKVYLVAFLRNTGKNENGFEFK